MHHLDCFGTESISAVCKANGFWYPDTLQLELDQGKFAGEPVRVSGNREAIMRPAMISDFETHLVNLFNILPVHEIQAIRHPSMSDEEGGSETQVFQ